MRNGATHARLIRFCALMLVCGGVATSAAVVSPRADAATTAMTISCDGQSLDVLSRGYTFSVVGGTTNFVMKSLSVFNETLGGTHVFFELHGFDVNPIQQSTCTWTATASNGSTSTFTAVGFFTPASG